MNDEHDDINFMYLPVLLLKPECKQTKLQIFFMLVEQTYMGMFKILICTFKKIEPNSVNLYLVVLQVFHKKIFVQ